MQSFACEVDSLRAVRCNIETYVNKLNVQFYGISKFNNFEISSGTHNNDIRFNPNENLNLGLGFNYKLLGFGAAINFGFLNNDQERFGATKSLDMQMDIFTRKILYSANLQYYQGYYWQNPDDFFHNWSVKDSMLIRPDIKTLTLGINGIYIFNSSNFSFKAAFQNTERQLASAGSWLLAGKLSVYGIAADSSLVPYGLKELYPSVKEIKGLSAINMGGAGGYAYTYVPGEYFYFNATLLAGFNLQSVSRINLAGENIGGKCRISSNAQFRIAIGCNKPKYYYGFSVTADSYSIKNASETDFKYNYGRIRFFYGRRFNLKGN